MATIAAFLAFSLRELELHALTHTSDSLLRNSSRGGGIETVKSAQPILVFAVEGPHCRGTITILARRKTRASVEWNRGVEFARLPIARLARGLLVIDQQLFPSD